MYIRGIVCKGGGRELTKVRPSQTIAGEGWLVARNFDPSLALAIEVFNFRTRGCFCHVELKGTLVDDGPVAFEG